MKRVSVCFFAVLLLMSYALASDPQLQTHAVEYMTLSRLLCGDAEEIEEVCFNFRGEKYEIEPEEFILTARDIWIEDVENAPAKNMFDAESRSDILYIQVKNKADVYMTYAAVTPYGEVDRYALFMSRMMEKDMEMSRRDVKRLYEFLPEEVRPEIPFGYDACAAVGICCALAVFGAGFFLGRKMKK